MSPTPKLRQFHCLSDPARPPVQRRLQLHDSPAHRRHQRWQQVLGRVQAYLVKEGPLSRPLQVLRLLTVRSLSDFQISQQLRVVWVVLESAS